MLSIYFRQQKNLQQSHDFVPLRLGKSMILKLISVGFMYAMNQVLVLVNLGIVYTVYSVCTRLDSFCISEIILSLKRKWSREAVIVLTYFSSNIFPERLAQLPQQ